MITNSPSKAAVFGAVLAALWAAHDCGDHLLQTDDMANTKTKPGRVGWTGIAKHVAAYHAVQVAALAALRPLGIRPPWWRFALAVVVSAATHAVLDRRWPVRWFQQHTGSAGFADLVTPINGSYVADQACHHGFLFVAAWIIAA
jgi:hypothetical protein